MPRNVHIAAGLLLLILSWGPRCLRAQTIIREPWYETHVDSTSVTLEFLTVTPQPVTLSYGSTAQFELGTKTLSTATIHDVSLTGLSPATTYMVRAISAGDTVVIFCSTSSDHRSSGEMDVFFNRSIDSSHRGTSSPALGDQDYLALLRDKLLSARASIDLAVYSFNGATGDSVAAWLIAATKRGIKVRFIADSASAKNSGAFRTLQTGGVPAILNSFGNNAKQASNIHHNKFIVIDGRGDDGAHAWTLTGSWNLTDQQTTTDYQNIIHIQDLSLARQFEREFNEEWGSDGDQPDGRYAKFSTNKHDTTARTFNVAGRTVHLFFSPNGGAFSGIDRVLQHAKSQVLFALLVFTRQDLAATLIVDHNAGVGVHGIINNTDQYEQTDTMRRAGLDVLNFTGQGGILLHHKYAIVDAGFPTATVITGSYNWSMSAESANNENVLTIGSDSIALLFEQEWLKRYHENGGLQDIPIFSDAVSVLPQEEVTAGIFPNPTHGGVTVEWLQHTPGRAKIAIYDLTGSLIFDQEVAANSGRDSILTGTFRHAGLFTVVVEHDGKRDIRKLLCQP